MYFRKQESDLRREVQDAKPKGKQFWSAYGDFKKE